MEKEIVVKIIESVPSDIIINFKVMYEDSEGERHYIEFDKEY